MKDVASMINTNQNELLGQWTAKLNATGTRLTQVTTAEERDRLGRTVIDQLGKGLDQGGASQFEGPAFDGLRQTLGKLSMDFAERGLTPSETATYVFSLKEVAFDLFRRELSGDELMQRTWEISMVIDQMGLYTFEAYTQARERLMKAQAQALTELSTPVIQVWEGVIALPLVGSIDSARAKEIMEKLLEAVVQYGADVVIIDITGVPVVDTQVANRLMRTVEAVRLLGTNSIITGINPVIAQTLVQLGVDLSQLTTKASLRAGLQQAFKDLRMKVSKVEAKR